MHVVFSAEDYSAEDQEAVLDEVKFMGSPRRLRLALICLSSLVFCVMQAHGQQTDPETGEYLPTPVPIHPASPTEPLPAIDVPLPAHEPDKSIPALRPSHPPLGPVSSAHRAGMFELSVVVTDAVDKPALNLGANDFSLLDNDQPTRIFTFHRSSEFSPDSGAPLLILMLDELNLPSEQLSKVKRAAEEFLRENGGHLAQPVVIYRLSDGGLSRSSLISLDGNAMADVIAHNDLSKVIWSARGRLNRSFVSMDFGSMRNLVSLRALGSIAIEQRQNPERKALVWFGSGWPVELGEKGFDYVTEFSTRLREARMVVDTVSAWANPSRNFRYQDFLEPVESPRGVQSADLALQVLAAHSGGLVLDDSNDLKAGLERCAAELGASYSITFDPAHTDHADEYHELKIVPSRPGLKARTIDGYYDEPVYFDRPNAKLERVTVAQLEQLLRALAEHGEPDLARHLASMELTERLSSPRLAVLAAALHKIKDSQALVELADRSVFLAPPAADVPADPAPGLTAQRDMLKRTFDYLGNVIPRLPNFFATRTTVLYQEPPEKDEETWKTFAPDQLLRAASTARGTVLYRNGAETMDAEVSSHKHHVRDHTLNTKGTFGPILVSILMAAAKGQSSLSWSRWESGAQGTEAVFRFIVPWNLPIFEVTYCCLPDGDGTGVFTKLTSYHGELAIDPATGAILRLMVEANLDPDLEPEVPVVRSDMMVEYAPTRIGDGTHICPVRSVSFSRGRTVRQIHEWGLGFGVYGPFETMLNDVTFGEYHMFRSDSRMLAGFDEAPKDKTPAAQPQ